MKILGVRTHYKAGDGSERLSAVDAYRVENPLSHLNKDKFHVDFVDKVIDESGDIDYQWEQIGDKYDVLYTSYIDSPKGYAYIKAVSERYGLKHVMDIDDNIFSVDPNNPAYLRYHPGSQDLDNAITILQNVDHLICSTNHLAQTCAQYRRGPISVMENYVNMEWFNPQKRQKPSKTNVIGYMGSSTHYTDLMDTGVLWALRRIFSERDDVELVLVGSMYEEIEKMFYGYGDRISQVGGKRDFNEYVNELWPTLPFDIGIAPLVDSAFNKGKSSIKFYEYAMADIVGIYSWTESYMHKVVEGETGYFAQNEQEWYHKLNWVLDNPQNVDLIRKTARDFVTENYLIEDHVYKLEQILENL